MKKILINCLLILTSILYAQSAQLPDEVASDTDMSKRLLYPAEVTAVVDGDTVKIIFTDIIPDGCYEREIVRLIGVNTPEISKHEYYAFEARKYTDDCLYRQNVSIELDSLSRRDKYGRLLAYIWKNGYIFNDTLIRLGYGEYYSYFNFDPYYESVFSSSEQTAYSRKRGIWGKGE